MNLKSTIQALSVIAATVSGFGAASAQEACTTYSVQDGDTLGAIANSAYGTYDYQQIFNANRDIIAASPNSLAPGTQLVLPCLDGRLRPDAELSSITERESLRFEQNRATTSE